MVIFKFFLSNPVIKTFGSLSFNKFMISLLTSSVAVAVKAVIIGLSTNKSINLLILL